MSNNKNTNKNTNKDKTRKRLLKKCNLPDIPETNHCFGDSTHHTCCLLGKKAREYSDASGNPIGSLSLKVQKVKTNKNNLTPWCTCTGSKVCSYYTKKFGKQDGTHIKFIGNLKNKKNKKTNKNNKINKTNKTNQNNQNNENNQYNENNAIRKLNIFRHKTPGILNNN